MSNVIPHWFAVYTSSRHEKSVANHLQLLEIEHYLPLYRVRHKWKNGSRVGLELPLFPGYLFVHLPPAELKQAVRVPGVLSILAGTGGNPAPLDDREVEILRAGLDASHAEPHPLLLVGQRARIRSGALAGLEGVVEHVRNNLRIVLTLDLIPRSIAVEIGGEDLEPIPAVFARRGEAAHSVQAVSAVGNPWIGEAPVARERAMREEKWA
jgi:transcription antitermination factor NusG